MSLLSDLPVGVLTDDFPVSKLEEVAPSHFHVNAGCGGPGEEPLRDASVVADPVAVLTVVDIRDALQASGKACAHILFTRVASNP